MKRPATFIAKFRDIDIKTLYPSDTSPVIVDNAYQRYKDRKLFNYSYTNFSRTFSYSRNHSVSEKQRILSASNLVIPETNAQVNKSFEEIRQISNSVDNLTLKDANIFLDSFKTIFAHLEDAVSWSESDYFLVPLKGGGVITELFNNLDQEQVLKIDSKRVPLDEKYEGTYGFGMHIPPQIHSQNVSEADNFIEHLSNKKVTMLELCVASGITTMGFLLDFYHRNIFPKEITVLSTAIAQQGFEISSEFAKELGIDLKFVSARMVYSLKDHFEFSFDPLTYDDGSLVLKSPYDAFQMIYNARKKGL